VHNESILPAHSKNRPPDAQAWWLVLFLLLAFCLAFADRQVVFSIFPVLKAELHFTNAELGLTGSLFLWVYAICSPLAGHIGDRFSKRALVAASLVLWSCLTALTGIASSPFPLLACRAGIGITESMFYPCAAALIAEAHSPPTRSRAFALFVSGNVFGVVLGGWVGGFMAQNATWRLAFYSLGAAGVSYALPFIVFLRRVPEPSFQEKPKTGFAAKRLLRIPSFVVICAVYGAFAFTSYLMYTWLPTLLRERFSLGLANAGFTATAFIQGGSIPGLILGGWIADRLLRRTRASRLWLLASAALCAGPCAWGLASGAFLSTVRIVAFALGLCSGMYLANLFASAYDVVPPEIRAFAAGLMNLIGACVSGFSGLLGGVLKDKLGIGGLMTYSGCACMAAGILLIVAIRCWFPRDCRNAAPPAREL
jgi:MFS family permease